MAKAIKKRTYQRKTVETPESIVVKAPTPPVLVTRDKICIELPTWKDRPTSIKFEVVLTF